MCAYARSLGKLEKTDALDAAILRRFSTERQPPLTPPPTLARQALLDLMMVRVAMVADISAHRHRDHLVAAAARRELRALFRALQTLQRALERQLDEWLDRAGTNWQERVQNLCLTVGVGTLSALQLLAYLPEQGACNRRQIAKLPGLAPLPWDSGHLRGVRPIQHGRSPARRVLFQCAVVAAGWIPRVGTTSSVPTTHNSAHAVNRLNSPTSPSPANP